MKKLPAFLAASALISFSASCDKHSWEETQVLHEGMHDAHHGEDAEHGEGHAEKPHGEEGHGEKKKADH